MADKTIEQRVTDVEQRVRSPRSISSVGQPAFVVGVDTR